MDARTGTDAHAGSAQVEHLEPARWAEANRALIRKAIAEFTHERILVPLADSLGDGDDYSLTSDDSTSDYLFRATLHPLNHWQVDAASITRVRAGEPVPLDALEFVTEFRATLGIDQQMLAVYLEELSSTLAGAAYKLAKPSLSADDLTTADFQTIEAAMTEGHPCFVANNGRLGFGVSDYRAFAPETGAPMRLGWLAVRAGNAGVSVSASTTYEQLLADELGADTLSGFRGQLAELGLDADDYHLMPVHPWQWDNKIAITFAADIARRDIVFLGHSEDVYRAQQSIRTFFNTTEPHRCYVKTSLSILNMGFMRGLSPAYMEKTPAINDWVHALVEDDVVLKGHGFSILREIAAVGYRNRYYEAATTTTSPYRKMLSALWRESPIPKLAEGERLATMASLLHVDRSGRSLAAALIRRSGLAPEVWLRRYLDAYLVPVLHCIYAHELAFMPHGENLILVLRDDVPVRVFMKDIAEEVTVMGSRREVPDDIARIHGEVPEAEMMLAVFTDVVDCIFRFLGPLLEVEGLLTAEEFWATVATSVRDYQDATPELAEQFAKHDFFAPEFELSCLNRLQLRDNQRMVDLEDLSGSLLYAGTLTNPVAEYAGDEARGHQR